MGYYNLPVNYFLNSSVYIAIEHELFIDDCSYEVMISMAICHFTLILVAHY